MMWLFLTACGMFASVADPEGRRAATLSLADTAAPPADTAAPTTPPVEFDGTFTIVSLVAVQTGPGILIELQLEPAVTVYDVLLTGDMYMSGRELGAHVDVIAGNATYYIPIYDPCEQFAAGVEYLTIEIGGDTASTSFTQAATFVWDRTADVVQVGSEGTGYAALCDQSGDWPQEWIVDVLFPGGRFLLAGQGTLTNEDGDTIVLGYDFEERDVAFGTWTWSSGSGAFRQVYLMSEGTWW